MLTNNSLVNGFSPEDAQNAADSGKIEDWVHRFLLGPGKNKDLSDGLKQQTRYWRGPVEISLSDLEKTCGPGLEYHEDEELWKTRISNISQAVDSGAEMPPLIVEYKAGTLRLCDGNHRCAGLEKAGKDKYWIIIWYNSENDYNSHTM